jgi:hypothetical protein
MVVERGFSLRAIGQHVHATVEDMYISHVALGGAQALVATMHIVGIGLRRTLGPNSLLGSKKPVGIIWEVPVPSRGTALPRN